MGCVGVRSTALAHGCAHPLHPRVRGLACDVVHGRENIPAREIKNRPSGA